MTVYFVKKILSCLVKYGNVIVILDRNSDWLKGPIRATVIYNNIGKMRN